MKLRAFLECAIRNNNVHFYGKRNRKTRYVLCTSGICIALGFGFISEKKRYRLGIELRRRAGRYLATFRGYIE